MCFLAEFVFSQPGEILDRCLVVAHAVIKRAEREVAQRRRVRHDLEQALTVLDHLGDFKTIPASFFFAEYRLRGNVEIKNPLDLASLRAAGNEPDYKNYSGDKHHE